MEKIIFYGKQITKSYSLKILNFFIHSDDEDEDDDNDGLLDNEDPDDDGDGIPDEEVMIRR